MLSVVFRISTLLVGMGILLGGNGLLGTLLGVRAGLEEFPETGTGSIMAAYFLAFILGTFFCPAIIRRVGHIRAFAALAATGSATAIMHALLVHPIAWGVLRVITGICMVGLFMVMESWLNVLAPTERRGRIFAAYTALNLTAMAAGQFFILAGDPLAFVPFALVAILYSIAVVPVALTRHRLYAISPLGVIGTLVAGLAQGAFWGMGAIFAQGVGLSHTGIAVFMGATIIAGALLQWPIGRFSDHHDRRTVLTIVCFAGVMSALVALYVAELSVPPLLASAFVYGGFAFSVYSLSVSHVNDHLTSAEVLQATSGLLLIYGIGATVGPALVGIFMDILGPGSLLGYLATVLALLGLFGLYRVRVGARYRWRPTPRLSRSCARRRWHWNWIHAPTWNPS
jgi:MFS family permease